MQANQEERLRLLEEKIETIIKRNERVEKDKAWEQSKTRVISIVLLTYILMCLVFFVIGVNDFMINALIPTIGYYLSTRSLPLIKKVWLSIYYSM